MEKTYEPRYKRGDKVLYKGDVAKVLLPEIKTIRLSGYATGNEKIFSSYSEPTTKDDFYYVLELEEGGEILKHIPQGELNDFCESEPQKQL